MARDKTDKTDKTPAATFATTATWAANEWGIPDWQDAAAYGDTKQWTFDRWRWEFYRRREDLREYFDARAEETFQHWQPYAGKEGFPAAHLRPDEPGFCAIVDVEARKRFGYSGLPNPRIGEQPGLWELRYEDDGNIKIMEGNRSGYKGFRGTFSELLDFAGVALTNEQAALLGHALPCFPTSLEPHEMTLTFDLNKPLGPQLKSAKQALHWHQSDLHGKPLQKRRPNTSRQNKTWLGYLRALDAREANASLSEMTEIFFKQGLLDRRKNPSGGYCAPPPQAARDMWEAANALRFNF